MNKPTIPSDSNISDSNISDSNISHDSTDKKKQEQYHRPPPKLSFWQTLGSVLYALIGVQSRDNAKQSLESGSIGMFILVGVMVVLVFIMCVAMVVYFAM